MLLIYITFEVEGVISSCDAALQKATFANVGSDLVLTANAGATNVTAKILFNSSGAGGASVSTKMIIDGSGNVGIGTTSPSYKLQVAEDTYARIALHQTTTGAIWNWGNDGSNMYAYYTNTAVRALDITNNGNVGIGTTSPAVKLDVNGNILSNSTIYAGSTANSRFSIDSGAIYAYYSNEANARVAIGRDVFYGGQAGIGFGGGGSFAIIGDGSATAGTSLAFSLGTSIGNDPSNEKMRLTSTGLGIGTTSPAKKLVVAGASSELQLYSDSDISTIDSRALGNTSNKWLSINPSGGNVGIGTTSPAKKLHVYSDGPNQGLRASNLDGVNMDVLSGANGGIVGTNSNHPLSLYTNSTEKVTITAAGNVGIGNTLPNYPLHVKGGSVKFESQSNLTGFFKANTTQCNISFEDTTNASNDIVYIGSIGNNFMIATNYDERVRVNSSGNLGIATTNPTAKLHVNGTVRMDNAGNTFTTAYTPSGGNTVSDVVGNNTDGRVLGTPDIWLRVNIAGTNYVFPGYTET